MHGARASYQYNMALPKRQQARGARIISNIWRRAHIKRNISSRAISYQARATRISARRGAEQKRRMAAPYFNGISTYVATLAQRRQQQRAGVNAKKKQQQR